MNLRRVSVSSERTLDQVRRSIAVMLLTGENLNSVCPRLADDAAPQPEAPPRHGDQAKQR